jgi:hypothetical protein
MSPIPHHDDEMTRMKPTVSFLFITTGIHNYIYVVTHDAVMQYHLHNSSTLRRHNSINKDIVHLLNRANFEHQGDFYRNIQGEKDKYHQEKQK